MSTLPVFPIFETIDPKHKTIIDQFLEDLEPYSDLTFTNLWIWGFDGTIKVSSLGQNLVVQILNYDAKHLVLTIDGHNIEDKLLSSLLAFTKDKEGFGSKLEYIHENVIRCIADRSKFEIEETKHNFDYIIHLPTSIELSGNLNKSKRRNIECFEKMYGKESEIRLLDLSDSNVQAEMVVLFKKWASRKQENSDETDEEELVLKRFFEIAAISKFEVTAVYVQGNMVGFGIDECMSGKYAVGHFMKADTSYKGVYRYLEYHSAMNLMRRGAEYLNIEQDLGEPNIRKAKMNQRPIKLLKKFSLGIAQLV